MAIASSVLCSILSQFSTGFVSCQAHLPIFYAACSVLNNPLALESLEMAITRLHPRAALVAGSAELISHLASSNTSSRNLDSLAIISTSVSRSAREMVFIDIKIG